MKREKVGHFAKGDGLVSTHLSAIQTGNVPVLNGFEILLNELDLTWKGDNERKT